MRKEEGRTVGLYFMVSPEEMALIEKKMEQAGTKNKRAYLRKMAVDGYIVNLDMGSVKELTKLLRSLAANTNQIARRCNETRNLYAEDVEDLRKGYAAAQAGLLELLRNLQACRDIRAQGLASLRPLFLFGGDRDAGSDKRTDCAGEGVGFAVLFTGF